MKRNLDTPAQGVLEMLRKVAPKMELSRAYDLVDHYQELRDDIQKDEFIIMMLLKAMGFNNSGYLEDKEMAEKLKDAPDEVWAAIKLALNVHAGYYCSPFTPSNWTDDVMKKLNIDLKHLQEYKKTSLYNSREIK